jgi:hypothetical protein
MKNTDDLLLYGYEFNLGKYFQDGWELYKKGAGNYIGFTIVFFIIVMMLVFVPFVNMLVTVIEYVLIAGIFIYTRNLTLNKGEFSNFFEGFQSFVQILLFTLTLLALMIPAIIIFFVYLIPEGFMNEMLNGYPDDPEYIIESFLAMFEANTGAIIFLYLVMMLYIMYLYISYSFTLLNIVDRKMKFWDAMELSRKVVSKNFWWFFVMYLIMTVMIPIVVIMTCGLGIVVGLPFTYTVIFAAYNDIMGINDEGEVETVEVIS